MKTSKNYFLISFIALFTLGLVVLSCEDQTNLETDRVVIEEEDLYPESFDDGEPLDVAKIFFEQNFKDNDVGLQANIDHEGWRTLTIRDGQGKIILEVDAKGSLAHPDIGITEFSMESEEPSPEEVLSKFPAGTYTITGKTVEGDKLMSMVEVSQTFLDPPTIVSPEEGDEVDPDDFVIEFDAPGAISVQIIVENDDEDNIWSALVTDDSGELTVSPEFLEAETEYKIEAIAEHPNGNKSIWEIDVETNGGAAI